MKITFRQIDAFQSVMTTGSIIEAAEMLGVSQPAVSRLIADLEAEVGFNLFQRSGRALVPTEEARLLVLEIRQVVSGMEHIKQAAGEIGKFGHSRLALVTTPAFSTQITPTLVKQFSKKYPNSMVRVEIEANDDTVEWLLSQSYDFGIMASEPTNPIFERLLIRNTGVFCVVPTNHRLKDKGQIYAKDLAGETFISYILTSRFRHEIDLFFDAENVKRNMLYETRTTDAICRLVASGLGVAIVGSSEEYLKTMPNCVALPFLAPINFRAYLFWSKNRPMSAIGKFFFEIAKENINID
jgi:DNA-binding transcriptional LysR family regulator